MIELWSQHHKSGQPQTWERGYQIGGKKHHITFENRGIIDNNENVHVVKYQKILKVVI